jgi:phage baseplate assembly protein W
MSDVAHWFGSDLNISASGDLLSVGEPSRSEQRLIRRLLTPPGTYIWHPKYGAGLGQYIGRPSAAKVIEGVIRAQLKLESAVASSPTPTIAVTVNADGVTVASIEYWNSATNAPRLLTFPINQKLVPQQG